MSVGGTGAFRGQGLICGFTGAPVHQETRPLFNGRATVAGETRPPSSQQLFPPPPMAKPPKRGQRPTRKAPVSQR